MRTMEDRVIDIFLAICILTVIGLKITGVITISWLWLLSPLWIICGFGLLFALGSTVIYVFLEIIRTYKRSKNNERN